MSLIWLPAGCAIKEHADVGNDKEFRWVATVKRQYPRGTVSIVRCLGEEYSLGKALRGLGTQQEVYVRAMSIGKRYISANRYIDPFVPVSMGKGYKVLVALEKQE